MSKDFPGASKAEHGTRAGYQMHKAQRSVICESCRQAQNFYMRTYSKAQYTSESRRDQYLKRKEALG